jgi:hypothetical protein
LKRHLHRTIDKAEEVAECFLLVVEVALTEPVLVRPEELAGTVERLLMNIDVLVKETLAETMASPLGLLTAEEVLSEVELRARTEWQLVYPLCMALLAMDHTATANPLVFL